MDDDVLETPDRRMDQKIKEAVRIAIIEEKLSDHEGRITQLERFRWWLLSAMVVASGTSTGTLLMMILETKR